jgi:VCBS repeat-containing protein
MTDPDSPELQGATVAITTNFDGAQDELAFANQLGITGTYDDTSGTLTLTGATTVANYQAALRAITYQNVSDNPSPPSRTLRFLATDAEGDTSTPATRDITLGAANDAATITTTAEALGYTEGDVATTVDGGLTVNDADDTNLERAQVRISAGSQAADELLFTNTPAITGTFSAGTLTLTGTATVADYQTALRSVQYRHTGDNPQPVKTVEFRADDGNGLGPASTRNIDVTAVNDVPTVTATGADLAYTENDGAVAIDGGLAVIDPDSTELSGATIAITGNFQSGQDELGFTDTAAITGTYDDTAGVLALSGGATVAQYQAALRSVTYENVSEGPTPLSRTVSFQATDSASAVSNTATRGIAITTVNDPPAAVNDSGTTDEDTTLNVGAPGVLANDTDVDPGDTKTVVELNGSAALTGTSTKGASVTINANGSYNYNPGSVFQGLSTGQQDTDSFTYTMQDGGGAQSTATVNLTITGVSDAPVGVADSFDAIGNTALQVGTPRTAGEAGKVITGSVLNNDTDVDTPQANLVAVAETKTTNLGGTITFEADGNFTYHPDDGDVGVTDTVQYTVSDGVASSNGTLSLPLAGQVWYVRNNAAAGGDGTSDGPFDTLGEAETASGSGDTVYVFDGDNTAVDLDTGFAMEADERLIGEHNGVSLSGHVLHAGTSNAHPTLTASNEDVIALASGTTVDGVNIDPSGTGGGISGGAGVNGSTIHDVNVADAGTAGTQPGVDLDGTTGTHNISDMTVNTNGATATGVRLNNAGNVNFAPASTITIASTGAAGLDASGTTLGTSTFDTITVTGSTNGGVSIVNAGTSTITFEDLSLTTTSGSAPAFRLTSAGTVSVPAPAQRT